MITVDINQDHTNENKSEKADPVFGALSAQVESLIVPCCEFYQSSEKTRENHRKCMVKCTSALTLITNYLKTYDRAEANPEFRTFDSMVCFQSLMFCLEHYKPMGKAFMRMFVHVYFKLKKAHNRFLFDRMCRVEADIAYHEIRTAIRKRLEEEGISGPQATELLHSFFSAETYLFATSRANFFRKKLHFSEEKIKEFEYTLRANGYVDSLDRIKDNIGLEDSEFSEFEDSLAPLERKASAWGEETETIPDSPDQQALKEEAADKKPVEFEYVGRDFAEQKESWAKLINTARKAFALAKGEKERTYLRCYLTLILIKAFRAGTIPVQLEEEVISGLEAYIDKPFFLKHWQDDYSEAYQAALAEEARRGKKIMEDAFYKAERMKTMARHLGIEPSTIKTYCLKGYNMMLAAGDSLHLVQKNPPPSAVPGTEAN